MSFGQTVTPPSGGGGSGGGTPAGSAVTDAQCWASASTFGVCVSPHFTSPTVTTQSPGDNSTKTASTAFTTTAINNAIAGVNPAVAALAASAANVTGTYSNGASGVGATFTVTATGAFTLDGISIDTIGQRVLLKNQTSAFQNGIYTATVVGSLGVSPVFTRALDYDTPSNINSTGAIPIQSGTVNAITSWLLTSNVATMGTDALTYTQFSINPATAGQVDQPLGQLGSSAFALNSAVTRVTCFWQLHTVSASKIWVSVGTADAGHNYEFGFYNFNSTLVANSTTTPAGLASTGVLSIATAGSFTLTAGNHYCFAVSNTNGSGTATIVEQHDMFEDIRADAEGSASTFPGSISGLVASTEWASGGSFRAYWWSVSQ